MTTKFKPGDVISFAVTGRVQRITVDEGGICYTVHVSDNRGRVLDLYIDEELTKFADKQ